MDLFPAPDCRAFGVVDHWQGLRDAGLGSLAALSSRSLGEVVTDRRGSWVRRVRIGTTCCYVKTYDYASLRDRIRGALRNTILAPSRARRELLALEWFAGRGFAAPVPWAVCERRRLGALHRACLVSEAWPGNSIDLLATSLERAARDELLGAVEAHIERVHRAGFRHRNLDLRNVLARRADDAWQIALLDAPRFRTVAAGPAFDRLAKADWDRLSRSVEQVFGRRS